MSIYEYDKEFEEKKLRKAEYEAGVEAGIELGERSLLENQIRKKLKKGKCTLRLVYTKKGNVLWFRARTYTKKNGRKIYHAFSKERKVKL